ncbi:response regulator transcription factor [Dyadobacter sp. CY356]|uniref:response regulator n=1 Tax=Dyadobacter sp. CY356 TaxID=2906442 RepID=UPI001F2D5513|nr:response regulator transcription factor [Dyadobacter sp. CY356]MCF0055135.1 response regulator transcription factor [Dyadobacter sp. CY356]
MNTILIADDHLLIRKGMEVIVRQEFNDDCQIDFAKNGKEVIEKIKQSSYDLLITDLNMPFTDGLSMITDAFKIQSSLKVLVVTVNPDNVFALRYMQAGVSGFVSKHAPEKVLIDAIRTIRGGKRYLTPDQMQMFTNSFLSAAESNPFESLSNREFEVAMLLLKGSGAIEVASVLSISPSTASSYRGRVLSKLGLKNVFELRALARHYGVSSEL